MMKSHKKLISILELFLGDKEELSLSEMAELVQLNKSTVNRIASFLVKENYLQQKGKRGKYSLGLKFMEFNYVLRNRMSIRKVSVLCMEKLQSTVMESCALLIKDGQSALVVDSLEHDDLLRISPDRKPRVPLERSAPGKIFLANMDEEELKRYLNSEEYTSHITTKPDGLEKQLKIVKEQNYAIEIEENAIGVSSVAVGIKGEKGQIKYAVAVVGPTVRLPYQRLISIVPDVKECASEISRWMGWDGQ